jgi:hypothetical protein
VQQIVDALREEFCTWKRLVLGGCTVASIHGHSTRVRNDSSLDGLLPKAQQQCSGSPSQIYIARASGGAGEFPPELL